MHRPTWGCCCQPLCSAKTLLPTSGSNIKHKANENVADITKATSYNFSLADVCAGPSSRWRGGCGWVIFLLNHSSDRNFSWDHSYSQLPNRLSQTWQGIRAGHSKFHTEDIIISQLKKPHMDKETGLLYAISKENSDLSTVKSALK